MNTILAVSAAATGARHLRTARNGQDAAASWVGEAAGAIVVCDGCGSGASSEVGARLGARLVLAAVATRLARGMPPSALWDEVRAEVTAALGRLVDAMVPGGADRDARAQVIHDCLLFTVVAAAIGGGEACVWAIGDGGYAWRGAGGDGVRVLGPFADNQPPYLAYELLGMPQVAHVESIESIDLGGAGALAVATDGAVELGLAALIDDRLLAHPDALRRKLGVLARGGERIDWTARRIARTPAALQDDGAVALIGWQP
jgi:hypothetical protein